MSLRLPIHFAMHKLVGLQHFQVMELDVDQDFMEFISGPEFRPIRGHREIFRSMFEARRQLIDIFEKNGVEADYGFSAKNWYKSILDNPDDGFGFFQTPFDTPIALEDLMKRLDTTEQVRRERLADLVWNCSKTKTERVAD